MVKCSLFIQTHDLRHTLCSQPPVSCGWRTTTEILWGLGFASLTLTPSQFKCYPWNSIRNGTWSNRQRSSSHLEAWTSGSEDWSDQIHLSHQADIYSSDPSHIFKVCFNHNSLILPNYELVELKPRWPMFIRSWCFNGLTSFAP